MIETDLKGKKAVVGKMFSKLRDDPSVKISSVLTAQKSNFRLIIYFRLKAPVCE